MSNFDVLNLTRSVIPLFLQEEGNMSADGPPNACHSANTTDSVRPTVSRKHDEGTRCLPNRCLWKEKHFAEIHPTSQ